MELEHLEQPKASSFIVTQIEVKEFKSIFHYHPEIELTYIQNCGGRRIVGDHIANFNEGDLILLGSNLPHCWINDPPKEGYNTKAKAIVINFYDTFLGDTFLKSPELADIKSMLELSKRGIQVTGKARTEVLDCMVKMFDLSPFDKMYLLLKILNTIATTEEITLLASAEFNQYGQNPDRKRIHKTYRYIAENLTGEPTVREAADNVHMSVSAFCHFFKRTTSLKFSEYVSDMRIGYASRLLIESDMSVSEVCFASGFKTLSYFNKRFKLKKRQTPHQFRSKFNQNNRT